MSFNGLPATCDIDNCLVLYLNLSYFWSHLVPRWDQSQEYHHDGQRGSSRGQGQPRTTWAKTLMAATKLCTNYIILLSIVLPGNALVSMSQAAEYGDIMVIDHH